MHHQDYSTVKGWSSTEYCYFKPQSNRCHAQILRDIEIHSPHFAAFEMVALRAMQSTWASRCRGVFVALPQPWTHSCCQPWDPQPNPLLFADTHADRVRHCRPKPWSPSADAVKDLPLLSAVARSTESTRSCILWSYAIWPCLYGKHKRKYRSMEGLNVQVQGTYTRTWRSVQCCEGPLEYVLQSSKACGFGWPEALLMELSGPSYRLDFERHHRGNIFNLKMKYIGI